MKKIGTITASTGFIFLGIWMMINLNNPSLGRKIIAYWPILIILIGLEILYYTLVKKESGKIQISGIALLIIIIFFFVSLFNGIAYKFRTNSFFNGWNFNFDSSLNERSFNKKLTLDSFGSAFNFETSNGTVNIEKSKDNKINIDTNLITDKDINLDNYKLDPVKGLDGYTIKITDNNIKSSKTTIYLPDGYVTSIKGGNLEVNSTSDVKFSTLNVHVDNGKVNLEGDIPNSIIKVGNGKISLENNLSKNIDISLGNGIVSVDTKDKNLTINTDIDLGVSEINDDKRTNSGIIKTFGTGEDKIRVKVDNGTIKINSGE
ncbi:hypothetical protein ACJDU8_00815 [Clostridium sp. WILCCON 0269]|uniref:Adhesin domain-containing protein n=1 Tax=Candidatus Clostridium eludens TaxID=3381663 RepID=A0ABW8SDM6_9CLOT